MKKLKTSRMRGKVNDVKYRTEEERKSKKKVRRKIMAGRRRMMTRWDEKNNKGDKEGKSLPWKVEE